MRRTLLLSIVLALALLLSVLGVEIVLRLLSLYEPPIDPPTPRNTTVYRADETVGYKLWPSARAVYRYPDDNPELIEIRSNSDGFRNAREFSDERPAFRMIVTGDSFVFGDGVHAAERTSNQLEARMRGWWVDNLGMTGWGVDNMLRATRAYAPKIRPDRVIVAIYTDDFRRVDPYYTGLGYAQPRFELGGEGGESLVSVPYPSLTRLERARINQARVQLTFKNSDFRWRLHEAMLNDFRRLSKELDFELLFVFFPSRSDTPVDQKRRGWLADYARRHAVPFLDLSDAFHSGDTNSRYIPKNWHWNAEGHALAARELWRFMQSTFPGDPTPAATTDRRAARD